MLTALELVQKACYEANIGAPSALVGETATSTLQLLNLFYSTGRELRTNNFWDQLKRSHTVTLEAGRAFYYLPQDFYASVPNTHWDRPNSWRLTGPQGPGAWAYQIYGYAPTVNHRSFRVTGPDRNPNSGRGQFQIDPPPGDGEHGQTLQFEYITSSWLQPPHWTASTAVSLNAWRNSAGNNYKCTTAGTTSTIAPTLYDGISQDGGVYWKFFSASAWGSSTAYSVGTYVTNGGNLYKATSSGTSASSGGPSGTTADIDDGTVVWDYVSSSTWAAYTEYAIDAHVTKGANSYRAVYGPTSTNTQKSGATGPTHTATTFTDGTAVWTVQTTAYEALVGDTDLVLFDDDLMILGLRWRFMEARGMQFQSLYNRYYAQIESAAGRFNPGTKISFADGEPQLAGYNPNLPEGNFG